VFAITCHAPDVVLLGLQYRKVLGQRGDDVKLHFQVGDNTAQ